MVVPVSFRATQDVSNEGEPRLALRGLLHGGIDLGLRGRLCDVDTGLLLALVLASLGAIGLELLLNLVRMQRARLLAVGLGNVIMRGRGRDLEDVVECGAGVSFVGGDLVADAEDFTVWTSASQRIVLVAGSQ